MCFSLFIVVLRSLNTKRKASSPMLVTLLGIVIDVRQVQPSKALSPILVTLSGMLMEVNPLQL